MKSDFSKIFINNVWVDSSTKVKILSPFDKKLIGTVSIASDKLMGEAIEAASRAFEKTKNLPVYKIAEGLLKIKQYFLDNLEEVAHDLSEEAGKPISLARLEVSRAIHTIEDGIEECKRIPGEVLSMDRKPWGENRTGIIERFPIGVIAAITPFNFPLNLVMHKVVPSIASKNTVVVRPATQTPFSALHIAKAYELSGLPEGGLNIVPSDYAAADLLSTHPKVAMVSFTGSASVGFAIKKKAWNKRVSLELGGNAAVVVNSDYKDLEKAAGAIASGGFSNAGQSCISAQRIFVHEKIYEEFLPILISKVKALVVGNPRNEKTQVASLINSKEADRVMEWIKNAKDNGAKIEIGGKRIENIIYPTILTNTTPEMKVNCMEVFGPIITVIKYSDLDNCLKEVSNSDFGLQAGVFTNDARLIRKAYKELEVGGLIINDVPTYRIDHMPYGGVKQSGIGREGVRFAIMEMTEPKLLVISY